MLEDIEEALTLMERALERLEVATCEELRKEFEALAKARIAYERIGRLI